MTSVGATVALFAALIATSAIAAPVPPASAPAPVVSSAHGGAHPPAGLNFDASKPIQVNADTFSADLNAETGTYHGNVVVVQGEIKMHADEVRVHAPDGKARRMEAHGHVVVDSPSGTAVGDMGVYDVPARIIHLTGHVVLTKNQNVMRGSALDVAMATGQAHLVATDASGHPARVQGVFIPQSAGAQHKPAPASAPPPPVVSAPAPATTAPPQTPPNP